MIIDFGMRKALTTTPTSVEEIQGVEVRQAMRKNVVTLQGVRLIDGSEFRIGGTIGIPRSRESIQQLIDALKNIQEVL